KRPIDITSAAGFALAPARRPPLRAFRRLLVYCAKNTLSEDLKGFSYQNFSGRCELLPSAAQSGAFLCCYLNPFIGLLDINKQHPDQVDPEEVTRKAQEEDPSSIEQLVSYTSSSPGLRRRAS
ncbi:hypothetical protein MUK42_16535, partial [Musa troglodytarum]